MKTWTIIKKEYKQIVKKKSFVIATILTPLLMAGFIFLPLLLNKVGRDEKTIEIIDFSGIVQEPFIKRSRGNEMVEKTLKLSFKNIEVKDRKQYKLIQEYEQATKAGTGPQPIRHAGGLPEDKKSSQDQASRQIMDFAHSDRNFPLLEEHRDKILQKKIDGIIIIPEDIKENRRIFFCALNISDFGMNEYISSTVQKIISEKILTEQGIELEIVEEAIRDVHRRTIKVKKEGTKESSSGLEYIMSIFMLTILFSVLMAYGQLIMRGVIEEKNNRIVEVLISSTNTQSLFYGKIIGIGLAGLTQVALWAVLAVVLLGSSSFGISKNITGFLTPEVGLYFLVFFIIGYFMYSILFSIVGASVNTDQEAQQFAAPITYLLIIPFIIGIIVTQNPNTPLVVAASLFPLFTPTLMFMRICVAVPTFSQIALSIVISLLFTMFLAWLGAKIFRTGILMYGKKPSIKEIMKWIKYK